MDMQQTPSPKVHITGRGSAFGFKPAPSIKVATNTTLYENMKGDMDINAGVVLDGIRIGDTILFWTKHTLSCRLAS